jgi:predicted dehydrogenase
MSGLRAGVVGLGAMGRRHVRVLSGLPGVELVGAVDPDPRARSAARTPRAVAGLDELLALGIDMCVVAAPTSAHADIGLRLADAGVPTLIEKPLAPDPAAGRELASAFAERALIGCVGHIERYNPAMRALRARVSDGELGSVFQVATRRQGPFPQRIRDVGVVLDLATHDIDLTQWVTGSRYLTVSACTGRASGRQYEDLVAVSGMLHDGTITSHLVNWLSSMKERVVTVTGELGCLLADTLTAELWLHRNRAVSAGGSPGGQFRGAWKGEKIRYPVARREALTVELENFRDAVLGQPAEIVTMRQGAETIEVADAILAASAERAVVGPVVGRAAAMKLLPGPRLGGPRLAGGRRAAR